jgi:hypothetical protein
VMGRWKCKEDAGFSHLVCEDTMENMDATESSSVMHELRIDAERYRKLRDLALGKYKTGYTSNLEACASAYLLDTCHTPEEFDQAVDAMFADIERKQ